MFSNLGFHTSRVCFNRAKFTKRLSQLVEFKLKWQDGHRWQRQHERKLEHGEVEHDLLARRRHWMGAGLCCRNSSTFNRCTFNWIISDENRKYCLVKVCCNHVSNITQGCFFVDSQLLNYHTLHIILYFFQKNLFVVCILYQLHPFNISFFWTLLVFLEKRVFCKTKCISQIFWNIKINGEIIYLPCKVND